jgi:hypothetical protein
VIFHADRVCHTRRPSFRNLCDADGVLQPLAKSFLATYKLELIEPATCPTRQGHWVRHVAQART